jgi:hypothetical protein
MMHFQVGPLRCWPGGLCLSRSIGDFDVGECIIPVPHVKQVKVCSSHLKALFCTSPVSFQTWLVTLPTYVLGDGFT